MIIFLKWIGIFLAVCALLYIVIIMLFVKMFSISGRTEKAVKKEYKNIVLSESVRMDEVKVKEHPLDYYFVSPSLARIESKDYLLESDGSFAEGRAVFDVDVKRQYGILKTKDYSLISKDNTLYKFQDDQIGDELIGWGSLGFVRTFYMASINAKYLLIEAQTGGETGRGLFQIRYPEFDVTKLTSDPYFTFSRAPLRFESPDQKTVVIVYFEGSYDYAFGGDSSRPKKSVVRIYSESNPDGADLVALSFSSGTVVDLKFEENGLSLTTDPSRPAQSGMPRLPPRFWRLTFVD